MSNNKEVLLVESKPDEEFYRHLKLGLIYKSLAYKHLISEEEMKEIMEEING